MSPEGAGSSPSICLIVPYFGPLPSFIKLFLRSCEANPSVNWLLVTDQAEALGSVAPNIRVKASTFAEMKRTVDRTVGFETALRSPYKLCDFRPAYGLIFAEDLAGFDFWGHCDLDVIFGDVRRFLTDDILHQYSKVLIHGHLSLYRNSDAANHFFELPTPGVDVRHIFESPENFGFDEFGGMRQVLQHNKVPYFRNDDLLADINRNSHRLETMQEPNYPHQCFYWQGGKLYRDYFGDTGRAQREYMYIHLLKRAMEPPPPGLEDEDAGWYITPRRFVSRRSQANTAAAMDELNPTNFIYDTRQRIQHHWWHFKRAVAGLASASRKGA